jgi:type I restriction enzyme, S subunit
MIDGLKPYPVMKDSGVPWLGEVPEHWDILPNRALFLEVKDREHPDEEMLSVTITKGVVPQKALLAESAKKDSSNLDRSAYKLVQPNDIAYNKMRAWQGAIGASSLRGIVSPAYVVMRPRNALSAGYYHQLLRTPMFAKEAERWSYGITSDMWSLRPEHFKMIYSVSLPINEQAAIIRFLDHADRRIRKYILAKHKLIKLLEEQKQAIIHRAVTRGLDPKVRLKRSDVEALGDVPEHWYVRQLGRFIMLQRGFDITKEQQTHGDVPVVSSGGVSSYHNLSTSPGPGVVVGRKGSVGTVHFVDGPFWAHDTTLWVKTFGGNHPRYIYYVLCHLDLKRFDTGSSNPTINRNIVHPEIVAFPPPEEQRTIASFLDGILVQTGKAVGNAEREIRLLREYRTRLIADVVTGKLDVREAAARLSKEASEAEPLDEIDDLPQDKSAAEVGELEAADTI